MVTEGNFLRLDYSKIVPEGLTPFMIDIRDDFVARAYIPKQPPIELPNLTLLPTLAILLGNNWFKITPLMQRTIRPYMTPAVGMQQSAPHRSVYNFRGDKAVSPPFIHDYGLNSRRTVPDEPLAKSQFLRVDWPNLVRLLVPPEIPLDNDCFLPMDSITFKGPWLGVDLSTKHLVLRLSCRWPKILLVLFTRLHRGMAVPLPVYEAVLGRQITTQLRVFGVLKP